MGLWPRKLWFETSSTKDWSVDHHTHSAQRTTANLHDMDIDKSKEIFISKLDRISYAPKSGQDKDESHESCVDNYPATKKDTRFQQFTTGLCRSGSEQAQRLTVEYQFQTDPLPLHSKFAQTSHTS